MKDYTEITVTTTHEGSELVADILWEYSEGGVSIADIEDVKDLYRTGKTWDYADESVLNKSGEVLVKAYVKKSDLKKIADVEHALLDLKARTLIPVGTLETVKRTVDGDEWIEQWKEHFKPIHIGNVVIVPEWVKYSVKEGETPVYIGSNTAFGTGEHETTAMCVKYLQKYVNLGSVVADVGSGSGILGITASKLGAKKVVMTDIDECAVQASRYNSELNGIKNAEVLLKNLLDDDKVKADIIVANIMAEILIAFAKDIGKNLNGNGVIILSGILSDRLLRVKKAYEDAGFNYVESEKQGEWSALVMKKA